MANPALTLFGKEHTVVPVYRKAALSWLAEADIYGRFGQGFLYLPSAAVLFIPCAAFSPEVSEIAWRLINISVFAIAVWRLSQSAARGSKVNLFAFMTLATLPAALACARNGQSTLIMTAMMVLATVDLAEERRWRAAYWLSLGLALKPLIIAMILVVMVIDWRMLTRMLVGIAGVLLLPFLTNPPAYVAHQYVGCWTMFHTASHHGVIEMWSQPFSLLALAGFELSETLQTIIRASAAVATLFVCWQAYRRHDRFMASEELFSFCVLYILLFNPRTENNTYAMLGPVLGICAAATIFAEGFGRRTVLLAGLWLTLGAGDELLRFVRIEGDHLWSKPTVGIVLLAYAAFQLLAPKEDSAPAETVESHAPQSEAPPTWAQAGTLEGN